jgi:hypothetical protein
MLDEGINIISKTKGRRPAILLVRDGKQCIYKAYSGDEQDKRFLSAVKYPDNNYKRKGERGRCRCQHCGNVMVAAWPEWRIYGLCNRCAYKDGKHIWVDDFVIAYITLDDKNQDIKYKWEQSGGGPITF